MGKVNYKYLFVLIARLILAGIFIRAALPKIQDPVAFSSSVSAFHVVGPELANWIALILPWLELVVGIGILFPKIKTSSSFIIAALLPVFIALHASAWARGLEISCGCFGVESSEKPTNYFLLIIRNGLLLFICLFIIFEDFKNKAQTLCCKT